MITYDQDWLSVAKEAYDAYVESAGGVSLISGDKLPPFSALKPEIQRAWVAAAKAVEASVRPDIVDEVR